MKSLDLHCRVPWGGFAALSNVREKPPELVEEEPLPHKVGRRDVMDTFLLSETFKYLVRLSLLPLALQPSSPSTLYSFCFFQMMMYCRWMSGCLTRRLILCRCDVTCTGSNVFAF